MHLKGPEGAGADGDCMLLADIEPPETATALIFPAEIEPPLFEMFLFSIRFFSVYLKTSYLPETNPASIKLPVRTGPDITVVACDCVGPLKIDLFLFFLI